MNETIIEYTLNSNPFLNVFPYNLMTGTFLMVGCFLMIWFYVNSFVTKGEEK